jgi:hypothetical protein
MSVLGALLVSVLAASGSSIVTPTVAPEPLTPGKPVILFLVDNSASLPPLDPEEKRVAALEKMFTFLQGQPYRLILFGGRSEIFVDDVTHYRNNGQWTDFYYAFLKARQLIQEYPPGTEFRIVLLTDAIVDPGPDDWPDVASPAGADRRHFIRRHSIQKTLTLLREMKQPLYVVLVGNAPIEGDIREDIEQAPTMILDMVRAANGASATPFAQTVASFFGDNGLLLRKFVYRVAPHEGLKKVEPVVRRIVAPPTAGVELQVFSFFVLPLVLFLVLLIGILVRSFPGPGDLEVLELSIGLPAHVDVDRLHKIDEGWASTGLSLVGEAKDAVATFVYQAPAIDLSGKGLDTDGLEPAGVRLLPMAIETLRSTLDEFANQGSKDEKIFVLNLDYMAKNMEPAEAERLLTLPIPERRRVNPLDFLRAKAHLLSNDPLRRRLTEPRVGFVSYGKHSERKEIGPGSAVKIGRYGFVVKDVSRGGRKDVRLSLYYDRVPSLLGLKNILPDMFQRTFRFRRSSQRLVA